jgi:HD-GYP domain-containing protein (c-di-GMP phosphodiesterase class II)
MERMLRRRLLKRLLLISLGLAVLAGTVVILRATKDIEERVLALSLDDVENLQGHVGLLAAAEQGGERARQEASSHLAAEHVAHGHFVVIELYDLARRRIAGAEHPSYLEVARAMHRTHDADRLGEEIQYQRTTVAGQSYVQIFGPLRVGGRTAAYFHGIYRVDPAAVRSMTLGVVWSLLLVVAVIFATTAALYPSILALSRDLVRRSGDLAAANLGMLAALGSAVAQRDRATGSHNYRVTLYAIRLAEAVGLSKRRIRGLIKGAFLHDVGKIGIPDAILAKPARLDPEEMNLMQAHVDFGAEIIGKYEWLRDALDVVRFHHEKYDGTGYPSRLGGVQIPIAARIFAIVDVFDALTNRRPYKEPASFEVATATLKEESGSRLDPRLLVAFLVIAPALYEEIYAAEEPDLARTLDALLGHYFGHPGAGGSQRVERAGAAPGTGKGAALDYLSGAWSLERPEK